MAEQKVPQLMPPGVLVTTPLPVPLLLRVSKLFVAVALKVAVTLRALSMLTVQLLFVPLHAPPQPAKLLPDAAWAFKVTWAPDA